MSETFSFMIVLAISTQIKIILTADMRKNHKFSAILRLFDQRWKYTK